MVAGLGLEEFTAPPITTDFETIGIEVVVEVIGKITIERFEHDSILADSWFADEEEDGFADADL